MHQILQPKELTYILAKNALTAMGYREWAVANVDIPIVAFVPNYFFLSEQLPRIIEVISQKDLLNHLEKVFDYQFESYAKLEEYFNLAPNIQTLAASVKDNERFVFDIEENPLPLDQIEIILNDYKEKFTNSPNVASHAMKMLRCFQGRFIQANNLLAQCDLYGGVPIIDAPTSWQYFLWKLEYSVSQVLSSKQDTIMMHVLHEELRNLPSFTGIPVDGIIELRKSGKLEHLREVFRKGMAEIGSVDGDSVKDVAKHVSENLRDAFHDYEAEINKIPKDVLSVTGHSVAIAGSVGLSIAAASTGSIPLAIITALISSSGIPSAKEIIKKVKEIYQKNKRIKNNPVGIFWKT